MFSNHIILLDFFVAALLAMTDMGTFYESINLKGAENHLDFFQAVVNAIFYRFDILLGPSPSPVALKFPFRL